MEGFIALYDYYSAILTEWGVTVIIAAVFVALVVWRVQKRKRLTRARAAATVMLTVYLLLIFILTVFSRKPDSGFHYELMLFWSYREILNGNTYFVAENLGNILMLMPYGILFPIVKGIRSGGRAVGRRTVLTGMIISLTIELLQLVLKCGLFEFDDIFHNTLGVLIGYGIYCIGKKRYSIMKA